MNSSSRKSAHFYLRAPELMGAKSEVADRQGCGRLADQAAATAGR
jgi:hypothetical protein